MAGHPSLFKGARLKIEWATNSLRDLDVALAAFRQSKPYSLFTEYNTETGETVVRARLTSGIDTNIQRLVGLIVTDLRSALDYMVCELAMLTDGDNDRSGVEFPIARNQEEFEKATTQRKVKRLPLAVREAIGRLQPYHGEWRSPLGPE